MSETQERPSTSREVGPVIKPRLSMPANYPHINAEQWRVLTEVIFPAAKTTEAVVLALDYCRSRNLDPFKRPVHIVPMFNRTLKKYVETIWPGIIELETTAARSKQWMGMDEPKWGPMVERTFVSVSEDERGNPRQQKITMRYPEWCIVPVYRLVAGQKCMFAEPVYWDEAYARQGYRSETPNEMWQKRPRGQLHKNAKAASLRAAFPEDADYAAEEMEGKEIDAGGTIIEGTVSNQRQVREDPPPLPQRKLGEVLAAIEKAAGDALTLDDIAALEADDDVRKVRAEAPESAKARMERTLQFHLDRVKASWEAQEPTWAEPESEPLEAADARKLDADEEWVAVQIAILREIASLPYEQGQLAFNRWTTDLHVIAALQRLKQTHTLLSAELWREIDFTRDALGANRQQ